MPVLELRSEPPRCRCCGLNRRHQKWAGGTKSPARAWPSPALVHRRDVGAQAQKSAPDTRPAAQFCRNGMPWENDAWTGNAARAGQFYGLPTTWRSRKQVNVPEMAAPRRHNAHKPWTQAECELLGQLAAAGSPAKAIADRLGRSIVSVMSNTPGRDG